MRKTVIMMLLMLAAGLCACGAGSGAGAGGEEPSGQEMTETAEEMPEKADEAEEIPEEAEDAPATAAAEASAGTLPGGAGIDPEQTEEWLADFTPRAEQAGYHASDIEPEIILDNDDWLCMGFSAGADGTDANGFYGYYVFDKKKNKTVSLKDVCAANENYVEDISAEILRQMRENTAKDENMLYFIDSDMPEEDFRSISGTQPFFINEKGKIVICFNEGEAAPMYMGEITFEIPEEVAAPEA